MFSEIVKTKQVKKGVVAYQYQNGIININGEKYLMYSMTEAIKKYRKNENTKNTNS